MIYLGVLSLIALVVVGIILFVNNRSAASILFGYALFAIGFMGLILIAANGLSPEVHYSKV